MADHDSTKGPGCCATQTRLSISVARLSPNQNAMRIHWAAGMAMAELDRPANRRKKTWYRQMTDLGPQPAQRDLV